MVDDQGTPVNGAVVTGSFAGDLNEIQTQTARSDSVVRFTTTATKKGGLKHDLLR